MIFRHLFAAGLLSIAAGTAARADSIDYSDFSSTAGLTTAGSAAQSGNQLQLTNGGTFATGAAYASNAFALGAGSSFNTSFQFQISGTNSSGLNANGFAFVLSSNPGSNGQSNGNLGIGTNANTSVAIEFSTFGNPNLNPVYSTAGNGKSIYNSNLVGVIKDGNTCLSGSGLAGCNTVNPNVGTVYGAGTGASIPFAGECDARAANTSYTRAGCMANGSIWSVNIKYANGLLTVSLSANGLGTTTPISSISYDIGFLGSNVFAGFTSSTGAASEKVSILNWVMNSDGSPVPEPLTLSLLGVGLGAVGYVRSRRRPA
jgi:hypothetical protein